MICIKCGKEIPEESAYCNMCGKLQEPGSKVGVKKVVDLIVKNKVKISLIILFSIVVTGSVFLLNNPINTTLSEIESGNYLDAIEGYKENILGNVEKEKEFQEKLKEDIANVVNEFKEERIVYKDAISKIETIKKFGALNNELNSAQNEVEGINNSRVSYKKAIEFRNSSNLIDAMVEFDKVIEHDSNFEKAQKEIENISTKYKEQVLKDLESFAKKEDYKKVLDLLNEALSVMDTDTDLIAKKANYEKLFEDKKLKERELEIKNLIEKQEVKVVKTSQYNNSINTNFAAVTVKNTTSKTVKSYSVGFMGFDKNGLPVKVGLGGGDFIGRGYIDLNVLPGETKYSGGGWYLDNHDVKTLIACIDKVEYYEDGTWENPYYTYWVEKYAEKPYK